MIQHLSHNKVSLGSSLPFAKESSLVPPYYAVLDYHKSSFVLAVQHLFSFVAVEYVTFHLNASKELHFKGSVCGSVEHVRSKET